MGAFFFRLLLCLFLNKYFDQAILIVADKSTELSSGRAFYAYTSYHDDGKDKR